ncbi:MAG: hypothetical protein ACTHQ3_17380 [Motilibacteraceae bacterium]
MQTDPTPPRRRLRAAALGAGWLVATAGVAAGAWLAVSAAGDGLGTGQRVLTGDQVRARLADVPAGDQAAPTPGVTAPPRPTPSPRGPSDGPGGSGAGQGAGQPTATAVPPAGGTGGSTSGGSGSGRTSSPRSRATSTPATAPVRTSAVATSGGTAAVACQGGAVSLRYATPRDGWTVAVKDRGPDTVEVVFARPTGEGSGDHGSDGSGGGGDHGNGGHGPEATAKASCVGGTPVWETETR